jgi:hypothetical protein
MKRRSGLTLVAAALMASLLPGVASAEPSERPPVGPPEGTAGPPAEGCPTGARWLAVQPSGPEHLSAAYDFNRDGWVCRLLLPGGIAFMDNVVR